MIISPPFRCVIRVAETDEVCLTFIESLAKCEARRQNVISLDWNHEEDPPTYWSLLVELSRAICPRVDSQKTSTSKQASSVSLVCFYQIIYENAMKLLSSSVSVSFIINIEKTGRLSTRTSSRKKSSTPDHHLLSRWMERLLPSSKQRVRPQQR